MSAQKGNILVPVLAAVALIALIAAGYFFIQNQKFQLSSGVQFATSVTSPTPAPTIKDETTNWKIYSNGEISFKFPDYYSISSPSAGKNGIAISFNPTYPGNNPSGYSEITFAKSISLSNLDDVEEAIKLGKIKLSQQGLPQDTKVTTKISAMKAIKVHLGIPPGTYTTYFVQVAPSIIYEISIYGDYNSDNEQVVDQILSTFKFTSQN